MPNREEAMATLFRQYYDELLRLARILLHDDEDARDAVGDVMARLMEVGQLPDDHKLVAYARSSVRFECLNRIKRMKLHERMRRSLPLDVSELADDRGEEEEQYRQYQEFVRSELTPQIQRVFQMHYGERLKYREIAQMVGVSEATVYKYLSQAILKLKNRFNP
jgi:RNA polymerase sigma-70 factor (ECF subfamily)